MLLTRVGISKNRGNCAEFPAGAPAQICRILCHMHAEPFQATEYFRAMRTRPDRAIIRDEWIRRAIEQPIRESFQYDGRIRRWAAVAESGGRVLRVILLPDGMTVHNAFFDRSFKP